MGSGLLCQMVALNASLKATVTSDVGNEDLWPFVAFLSASLQVTKTNDLHLTYFGSLSFFLLDASSFD